MVLIVSRVRHQRWEGSKVLFRGRKKMSRWLATKSRQNSSMGGSFRHSIPPNSITYKLHLTARPFGDKWIFSCVRRARRACLPWRSVDTFHPVDRILARLKMSAHQKLPYKPHR